MIVIDASAIVKLVIKEEGSLKATTEMEAAIAKGEIIVSPDVALAETLNAIWKHYKLLKDISKEEVGQRVDMALLVWDKITKIETEKLAHTAIGIATSNNITAYDSLYIAASKSNNAPLLTFDEGIKNKAEKLDLTLIL